MTKNFRVGEFACKDGTPYPEKWLASRLKPLCDALEKIREVTGPIHILSGYRTPKHNKKVGGALRSQHVEGIAVDIAVRSMTPANLYKTILNLIADKKIQDGGLGLYKSWVHYDQRGTQARWKG